MSDVSQPEGQATAPVSVVVPTRFRSAMLARAVASVLAQTLPVEELIVVIDGPDEDTSHMLRQFDDERIKVVDLPISRGPSGARNEGVARASSDWVAFLDDDDVWLPTKMASQWRLLSDAGFPTDLVLATGLSMVTEQRTFSWPKRNIRPGERVADYLFVRTRPGEGVLQTSTLLVPRAMASVTPMPEHLRVHEDWDWFLSLEGRGAQFRVLLAPLVRVDGAANRASASRGVDWETSLAWAMTRAEELGPSAFSGFLLTEVGRAVARSKDRRAALAVALLAGTGRARLRDYLRFVSMQLLPEQVRWRMGDALNKGVLGSSLWPARNRAVASSTAPEADGR